MEREGDIETDGERGRQIVTDRQRDRERET
jgi:hypothetical protein